MRCPICKGKGEIADPKHTKRNVIETEAKRVMARALRDEGYSMRDIMRLVGWKSPRSVSQALEKRDAQG